MTRLLTLRPRILIDIEVASLLSVTESVALECVFRTFELPAIINNQLFFKLNLFNYNTPQLKNIG